MLYVYEFGIHVEIRGQFDEADTSTCTWVPGILRLSGSYSKYLYCLNRFISPMLCILFCPPLFQYHLCLVYPNQCPMQLSPLILLQSRMAGVRRQGIGCWCFNNGMTFSCVAALGFDNSSWYHSFIVHSLCFL